MMSDYFLPVQTNPILVVGDVILDRYLYGKTRRISPEAPVPVVKVDRTEERPGGAANVAANIRALGFEVQLIGITGDDEFADTLLGNLEHSGVICDFVRQKDFPTITKIRVLSQNQQLLRLDYEEESEKVDASSLHELFRRHIEHSKVVILSDYAKGSLKCSQDFIALARENNAITLVDPKGSDFTRYRGASYLTPNFREFETIVGTCKSDAELVNKALILSRELELKGLLITRGEQGMSFVDAENETSLHLPARSHEVYDVTGAGDTVIATLAAALAGSYSITQALHFSNLAAGMVVEKLGAACVSANELNESLQERMSSIQGEVILSDNELTLVLESARSRGERIVMTNGCFDLIHAGHVDYLQKARELGDRLLIAVNDDDSVKRLKGERRPVNKLDKRMKVLAGLRSTDWVCSFSTDTPEELIKKVKPDFLVKGADYEISEIVGADIVQSYGGEVLTIALTEECSTSALIDELQDKHVSSEK